MLALAVTDAAGAVLFGALYALGGAGLISHGFFLACLVLLFALVTVLWVRTERRHGRLEPLRRVARGAGGLLIAWIATPALSLMPLFWLDTQLPPEAGLRDLLAPSMTLVLIALVLVLLVNVVGAVFVAGKAAVSGRVQWRQAWPNGSPAPGRPDKEERTG